MHAPVYCAGSLSKAEKAIIIARTGKAVATCLHRNAWTPELLLEAQRSVLSRSERIQDEALQFYRPLVGSGRFPHSAALISIVRKTYCGDTHEEFDFLIAFNVRHLQSHEELLESEAGHAALDREECLAFQNEEWEEAMGRLGAIVGSE